MVKTETALITMTCRRNRAIRSAITAYRGTTMAAVSPSIAALRELWGDSIYVSLARAAVWRERYWADGRGKSRATRGTRTLCVAPG